MQRSQTSQTVITVYPLGSYTFGTKAAKTEKDRTLQDRLARLKHKFEQEGTRRSVDAVLLVHEHNHPHVLLLQAGINYFRLPGGALKQQDDEVEGLKRKLGRDLAPTASHHESLRINWDVGECIATWQRPGADTVFYPYVPPHVGKARETKRIFIVALQERHTFAVPKNMKLVAVPLFELYDNAPRYGPMLASLPALLSRFRLSIFAPAPMASVQLPQQQEQQQQQQDGQKQQGQQ